MSEWKSVKTEPPKEGLRRLVTNNIGAVDAFGQMSHIWILFPIRSSEPQKYGEWTGFDEANRRVCNITHWMPLPSAGRSE